MVKTTLHIDGMYCEMCEVHINDVLRNAFPEAKKVTSSYKKAESSFLSEEKIDAEKIKEAIRPTGYIVESIQVEPYEKKKWF